jgi:hypothetical protein
MLMRATDDSGTAFDRLPFLLMLLLLLDEEALTDTRLTEFLETLNSFQVRDLSLALRRSFD